MGMLMAYGVSYSDFWNMTYKEINIVSKEFMEKEKRDYNRDTHIAYVLANMNAHARFGKIKKYENYFPKQEEEINMDMRLKKQLLELANAKRR